jgi:peroxiredoxin
MPFRSAQVNRSPRTHADALAIGGLTASPQWMARLLWITGAYHLVLGLTTMFFPFCLFRLFRMPLPHYPELLQALGALVAAFGLGYVLAANNGIQNWLLVLTGFLSYISLSAFFLHAAAVEHVRSMLGAAVIGNALIWSSVLGAILYRAYRSYIGRQRVASPEVQEFALRVRTNGGISLKDLSIENPVMLVFLRHTGCMFCRETLGDIAVQRRQIEATGTKVVLVHMGREPQSAKLFEKYGIGDMPRVSDPNRALYRAFGLGRGSAMQLFGPGVWLRAFVAAVINGHGTGSAVGDVFQMPGVFLVYHGHVVRSFIHHSVADRPDYRRFVSLQSIAENEALG